MATVKLTPRNAPNDYTKLDIFKLFGYNKGNLIWLVDRPPFVKAGAIAGTMVAGYIRVHVEGKTYAAHKIIWLMKRGPIPDNYFVDHKDRVKSNNLIDNLRLATRAQNRANSSIMKTNKTGYTGVRVDTNGFKARIEVRGQKIELGVFKTALEASEAYQKAKKREYGKFVSDL